MEEGTRYICKPKNAEPTFFTVQAVLPTHEGQPAPYRVLNEHGMVCYLSETGDGEMPYICVLGLHGDGEHPSEVIAVPDQPNLV